jgi:hypothetical protein
VQYAFLAAAIIAALPLFLPPDAGKVPRHLVAFISFLLIFGLFWLGQKSIKDDVCFNLEAYHDPNITMEFCPPWTEP